MSTAVTVETLTPRSAHEVHTMMRDLIAAAAPVRIAGAGTWRDAGGPVTASQTLSLRELSGIVEYVPGDLTLTALAGTSLAELTHATAAHGQWIGLDPAGDRHGTIGATIATASSGPLAHAFGTPRDLVLGLDAITGYGDLVRPGGRVVKNVAGFDLVRLYTGAWGTLGPITQVTLRLRALPVHDVTLAMPAGPVAQLDALIQQLRANSIALLACEWIDGATAQQLRIGQGNDTILLRVGGNDPFVRGQQVALSAIGPCTPCDPAVWGALATLDAQAPIVLRLSGAVSDLPARLERIRQALTREQAIFSLHASVGRGTIRVIVSDPGAHGRAVLQATVIGEHRNVERLPQAWWTAEPDPFGNGLAARIRRAFDPQHLCNRREAAHG
jgi:FAD/FMN-containing dehydrogenase